MEMVIDFPGGSRVDAHFGDFTVATDQPPIASSPSPFEIFLDRDMRRHLRSGILPISPPAHRGYQHHRTYQP
jgi:hypothetical protein